MGQGRGKVGAKGDRATHATQEPQSCSAPFVLERGVCHPPRVWTIATPIKIRESGEFPKNLAGDLNPAELPF